MGEAKRKLNRFLGPIRAVLTYREATPILAFQIIGDEPEVPGFALHELAALGAFPDIGEDRIPATEFPKIDDLMVTDTDSLIGREGDWAVLDTGSGSIGSIIDGIEFTNTYTALPALPGWFIRSDSPEVLVGIRDYSFVLDGGLVLDDPVPFMRRHVRTGGALSYRGGEAITLQTVRLTPLLGEVGGRDHAEHIAVLANAIIASNETDCRVLADAIFFQRCMSDPQGMLGDPTQSEAMAMTAHKSVASIVRLLPWMEGLKSFAKELRFPIGIWLPREASDPLVWSRFGEAFAALARAGHTIDESAPMWRIYARTDNPEGRAVQSEAEAFLDRGQQLAGGMMPGGTMRLVRVLDTNFLAFIDTDATYEIVAWH
ncbi:hypothetical protein [Bosea sp. RAC05]|uniref:hypothetical protein n=1 Tax=Bosea sp. RAC05 TaxID=1842539 RepID=UPI00085875B0|nr:hypothetical protein [Bosea sp. RAC05]AOG02955.1 hypothetical protein BSY19_4726 [Bosea sp. RAC05]